MYYREHGIAHFHAEHQGEQATFTIDGEILAGQITSRTARRLIKEWATAHRQNCRQTGIAQKKARHWRESHHLNEENAWHFFRQFCELSTAVSI